MQRQHGFTLVEIAIVLVIIGLLLGGVLKGQEMIENARIKSVVGDRQLGIGSLPVRLGVQRAAQVACAMMLAPQFVVIALLFDWGQPSHAWALVGLVAVQAVMMRVFLASPSAKAIWYSGFGVPVFVIGMLVSAFAARAPALVAP